MSTPPPFLPTDMGAFFTGTGGALENRVLNLGGDIGPTEIVTSLLYNIAPDANRDIVGPIGGPRGQWAIYYPFYLLNKHESETVINVKIWIYRAPSDPNIGVAIGLDPAGKNGVAKIIPDNYTAPAGVTFTSPFTEASTTVLKIPIFAAGDKQAVWVKQFGNKGIDSLPQVSYGIKWSFETIKDDTGPISP